MASPAAGAVQQALREKLQLVVRIARSRLKGEMALEEDAPACRPGDSHSSDEEDDDDDLEAMRIKKMKISPSGLRYSDEENHDDDLDAKKTKKKEQITASGLHHSHEKSHKPDGTWRIKLKKARPVPKDSDEKTEEREKIREALQKRCFVKIEKHAAIPLRQQTLAAGDTPGEVKCLYCSRTFKTVGGMKVHRTRIHFQKEGNVPWCVTCREVFRDVKKLNQHSKRCAGIRKNVAGTGQSLTLQRTPASFLVPLSGHVHYTTPRGEQLEPEPLQRPDGGGFLRPTTVVPKYQFQLPTPSRVSPEREATAEKGKHITFGGEVGEDKGEVTVESPARSPRRKSLRPRKVLKLADEPSRENAEWEGAHFSFQTDGERRVQPSRSAKSAVESYCECSNKSAPEDSQDGQTEKTPGEGSSVHNTTGDGKDLQDSGPSRDRKWTSGNFGVQISVCPSSAKKRQYQTEEDGRGVSAVNSRLGKKESVESRHALLGHSNHPSVPSAGGVKGGSVTGGQMKSCVRQAGLTVQDADGRTLGTRHLVQKNCPPVTEMVRMSTIPSGSKGEPATYARGTDCQEAAVQCGENILTAEAVGLYKYFHHSANAQSLSLQVSCQNIDSDNSGDESESSFENLYIADGEQQLSINTTREMNSLESGEQNNLTHNTNCPYSSQKQSSLSTGKDDAGKMVDRNTDDTPLNLSSHTSTDEVGNNEPSDLIETGVAPPAEVDDNKFGDKSATDPQNGNSPESLDGQQVDEHLDNDSHDVTECSKEVHENRIVPTASVRDAAVDSRKVTGKSHTVPDGTEEVLNFILATTSSNCASSDTGDGPNTSRKDCDTTKVEADEQPACEDKLETEATDNMANSPSQFSESEDLTALDSVRTVAASADDEASDDSETETGDEPSEVWSPDHQSENGDRRPATLTSNGLVSSTTSITATFNDSSTGSEICESRYHSPETGNNAEEGASRRPSSSSDRSITINTLSLSHNDNNGTVSSLAGIVTNGELHSEPVEQRTHLQTADSTTEDVALEKAEVSQALSATQSPRAGTSQSQPSGRNTVDENGSDIEICEIKVEKPNTSLREEKTSRLPANSGGDATLVATCQPSSSKERKETDQEKEPEEATLRSIEIMKKMLETIPKPPQSPAQEQATQTDRNVWNSSGSDKTAEATTQKRGAAGFFLAPATLTTPRVPTPRIIPVAKDLSEYESSSCSSFAEHMMKTHEIDSSPAATETEESLLCRNSRTDLRSEELSRSSLTDGGVVLNRGSFQSSSPVAAPPNGGSNPSKGTVQNVTNCAAPAQGVTLGLDSTAKVASDAGNVKPGTGVLRTGDSWLVAMTPLRYSTVEEEQCLVPIRQVLNNSPSSTAAPVSPLPVYANCSVVSPLSSLVALESVRSPQNDLGTKMKGASLTEEQKSPVSPPDGDRESQRFSDAKLPPFSTLAKSSAETERPNRPCSLPAGVKMELTEIKETDNGTSKSHTMSTKYYSKSVNASSSTCTRDTQSDIDSKLSSTLAECYSPKEEEPYILYEHRPKAIDLSLRDRPSSVPIAKSDQKEPPNTGSFHRKNQLEQRPNTESNQNGTLMVPSITDQYVYQKEITPQEDLGNGTPQGLVARGIHPHSQQPHSALSSGSPSNVLLPNPSYTTPQDTPRKEDASPQGVTPSSWTVSETAQVYQQNKTRNDPPVHKMAVQGMLRNTLSNATNTTYKNVPQVDAKDISSAAGSEVGIMPHSTREAPSQNTMTRVGEGILPNLPDIIGCRMADSTPVRPVDTVGNKQTERHSSVTPADSQTTEGTGTGRRGRGGRRGLPSTDDLHPCECPCGKICKNYRGLEQHKARAHRDVVFFEGDGRESCCSWPHVLDARSFQCPCGARFGRLDAIRKHFATEQAEAGGSRWWISDRVPICVCRQANRRSGARNCKVPSPSHSYPQSYRRAGQTPRATFGHVFPQEAYPDATVQHQHALGESKWSHSSALETRGNPVTDVRGSQNLPTGSFGGIRGQSGSGSNPPGFWSPPFPVSRPPSLSAIGVTKSAQTTAQHYIHQTSPSEWWSPTTDAQSSVAQPSSTIKMLASMQDCSNITRNPVERYNLGSDSGSEFQRIAPALLARSREMTVTTGTNAERLQQLTKGGPDGWSRKYSSQSADGSWTVPAVPLGGTRTFSTQQQHDHTGRATLQPDVTDPHEGRQHSDVDRPAACRSLGNTVSSSGSEPQQWNFQHPRSLSFFSTAQPQPKPKQSFTLQEFCPPHQNVAPFHCGMGTNQPPAAHGQTVTSATRGHPWQSHTQQTLAQSDYSGSGTGFEITPQFAGTSTPEVRGCYSTGLRTGPSFRAEGERQLGTGEDGGSSATSLNAALMAIMRDDPEWKLLPNSNNN